MTTISWLPSLQQKRGTRSASMRRVILLSSALGLAGGALGCGGLAADGPSAGSLPPEETTLEVDDALGSVLLAEVLGALAQDLQSIRSDEQRFMRYAISSHWRNALDPRADRVPVGGARDGDAFAAREGGREVLRLAVLKLANSASSTPLPHEPVVFGDDRLFQRIDLRHYGWERPIDLAGQRYADGWEAIVSRALLAVEHGGRDADRLRTLSGARVPWLLADDFVAALAGGEVYYELLGLPGTLNELQAALDPPWDAPVPPLRAGFESSGVSRNPRVVERRGARDAGRGYWQALDFADAARGARMFFEPLSIVPDATEMIFPLPNGLHGYFIADASGARATASPLSNVAVSDPSQSDGVLRSPASCFSCHDTGIVAFRDQVRPRLLAPDGPPLTREVAVAALDMYPEASALERFLEEDSALYQQARRAAGLPTDIADPVSRVFSGFWEEVGPRQAAGELFVEPDVLQRELGRLPSELAPLRAGGTVERSVFARAYPRALCALHRHSTERPVACD